MGAGCYYTNRETQTKAVWVSIPEWAEQGNEAEYYERYNEHHSELVDQLQGLGYDQVDANICQNGLFEIHLESTYHGDGIVIRMEPITYNGELDMQVYNLAMANHQKCYDKIIRELKSIFELRIATSGYTSTVIN